MGWNSTLVAVPDGSMADYLASLEKVIAAALRALPAGAWRADRGWAGLCAGAAGAPRAAQQQIVDAVNGGARTIGALLRAIYPRHRAGARLAARMTLEAHIEYLDATVARSSRVRRDRCSAGGCRSSGRRPGAAAGASRSSSGDLVVEVEQEGLDAPAVLAEIVERADSEAERMATRRAVGSRPGRGSRPPRASRAASSRRR